MDETKFEVWWNKYGKSVPCTTAKETARAVWFFAVIDKLPDIERIKKAASQSTSNDIIRQGFESGCCWFKSYLAGPWE